ncbi:MAG: ABC transporter ATP-binding protein [Actinomycetota bacterium]|nr:ABC transporter ATP-binding protein [Actinomycetota bacterium]
MSGAGAGAVGDAVVVVDDLTFRYPDGREALRGVDLRVGRGERVALVGPNGAGKTTLALHLNGVHRPSGGRVVLGDVELDGRRPDRATLREVRRRVGIVFQDPDDQLFMPTVRDDVAFGPGNLGLGADEVDRRVAAALDVVDMADRADRAPRHLSYGERRRAAVATVLAMEPDLLVLDEPTANLDPASRRALVELLGRLDVAMIVVTHDLPFALEVCPRAVLMDDGAVVADRSTEDLLADADLLAAHRLELPYRFAPR